jgi:predicted NUDIX family phosphoesterase
MLKTLEQLMTWVPRRIAERSLDLVQPIPCALLHTNDQKYFVFRRKQQERRDLSNTFSLLIGGHVDRPGNPNVPFSEVLVATLRREVNEEVGVTDMGEISPIGLVVDCRSVASSRHVALVYQAIPRQRTRVRAEEEFALHSRLGNTAIPAASLTKFRSSFDPWSSIVFEEYIAPHHDLTPRLQGLLPLHVAESRFPEWPGGGLRGVQAPSD